jgi:hypothetical protein
MMICRQSNCRNETNLNVLKAESFIWLHLLIKFSINRSFFISIKTYQLKPRGILDNHYIKLN